MLIHNVSTVIQWFSMYVVPRTAGFTAALNGNENKNGFVMNIHQQKMHNS